MDVLKVPVTHRKQPDDNEHMGQDGNHACGRLANELFFPIAISGSRLIGRISRSNQLLGENPGLAVDDPEPRSVGGKTIHLGGIAFVFLVLFRSHSFRDNNYASQVARSPYGEGRQYTGGNPYVSGSQSPAVNGKRYSALVSS